MLRGLLLSMAPALSACAAGPPAAGTARDQVWAAETAFAQTMADRDFTAFAGYISDEAIFYSGEQPMRGKAAVLESWARFFAGPQAPFSWQPDSVEVLASGGLALSSGPVRNPAGKPIARFNSIWRLEPDGSWRVVFDKGSPLAGAP